MIEKIKAMDGAVSAVSMPEGLEEHGKADGRYFVTCREVVPEHKSEYDAVFQRYLAAIESGAKDSAREFEEELHSFPMQTVWEEPIENVVCTAGKNLALDTILAGSGYTVTGPYMGLISSVSYSAVAAGDTMSSHSGWTEAGSTNAPTFAARGTPAWSSASGGSKSTSSAVSFTMTGAGTLVGAFIVFGSGAVSTLMSTAGTLLSAGAFSGGNQTVANGNVVTVSYSLSI